MPTNTPAQRDIDLEQARVTRRTREIDAQLRKLSGFGDGTSELLKSIDGKLPGQLKKKIRNLASFRNQAVHEDGFLESLQQAALDGFQAAADEVKASLDAKIASEERGQMDTARAAKLAAHRKAKDAERSPLDEAMAFSAEQRRSREQPFPSGAVLTEKSTSTQDALSVGFAAIAIAAIGYGAFKLGLLDDVFD